MKKLNLTFTILILVAILASCNCNNCPEEEDETPYIIYPTHGYNGENLLDTSRTQLAVGKVSLAAELSEGAALKVVITGLDSTSKWWTGSQGYLNWHASNFDHETRSQIFTAMNDDSKCEFAITMETSKARIDFYEMGDEEPTFSKIYD
jgi:hypothetical protein